jgi:hypothetical protein
MPGSLREHTPGRAPGHPCPDAAKGKERSPDECHGHQHDRPPRLIRLAIDREVSWVVRVVVHRDMLTRVVVVGVGTKILLAGQPARTDPIRDSGGADKRIDKHASARQLQTVIQAGGEVGKGLVGPHEVGVEGYRQAGLQPGA